MRERAAWLTLLGAAWLVAAPTLGEDVYLKNGRAFLGVIAHTEGDTVRIQMPGGDLGLPLSTVLRVDASGASYRDYLARRNVLQSRGGTAAEWLDLARWAKGQGMGSAAREAALNAARLNPEALGLQSLLGELGFVLDKTTGGYIPFEDSQARQGLVFYEGAWITSAERGERVERYREQRQERERLAAAQTAAAQREEWMQARAEAQGEANSSNGIPLDYAYYGGGGFYPHGGNGGHRGSGRNGGNLGGSLPPGGGIPWRPQRAPCASCVPTPWAPAMSTPGARNEGTLKPFTPVRGASPR